MIERDTPRCSDPTPERTPMIEDDQLDEALHALRTISDGTSRSQWTTRARILARTERRARRKHRLVAFILPIAATFMVGTAWGALSGRLPYALERLLDRVTDTGARGVQPVASSGGRVFDAPDSSTVQGSPGDSVATDASKPSSSLASSAGAGPTSASPLGGPASTASSTRLASTINRKPSSFVLEQSLYAAAHDAHFTRSNPAAALGGWNAYLAAYPAGHFAIEARYNRALSLVRLERRAEAREALIPFARGTHGDYRRAEARDLLDALDASGSGHTTDIGEEPAP